MKILFVCRANIGRSQMAEVIYRKVTSCECDSAGTRVDSEVEMICERPLANPVIRFMKEEGVDVSNNTSKQVRPNMLDKFDKVVVMAEPETIPPFLLKHKNTILWTIEDPEGKDDDGYRKIIYKIKYKILELIKENGLVV